MSQFSSTRVYRFEWDPAKARANFSKHKTAFESAATIFRDPLAITIYDQEHSRGEEERWITIGLSATGAYLTVVHTWKHIDPDNVIIRIISARRATKREVHDYEESVE